MIEFLEQAMMDRLTLMLPREAAERIDRVRLNRQGGSDYDAFGMSSGFLKSGAVLPFLLYEHYFRVRTHGIENFPARGRAILVSNHSGTLPFDGAMIVMAGVLAPEPPRLIRSLVDYWAQAVPFISAFYLRTGQVVGVLENAERLLDNEELLLVFPEGTRGLGKPFTKRYKVQDFTVGFVELAVRYRAPIIPMAVIGAEEQYLNLGNLQGLARRRKMPYLPLTPTFPLLGPLGAVPKRVQYHIHFGPAMNLMERGADIDVLDDPGAMRDHAGFVRSTVQELVDKGLRERDQADDGRS